MSLGFRGRKTIRIGPVRLHFSQRGYTGWGLKIGRWTWSARTGKHSLDTPGFGSVQWGGNPPPRPPRPRR